MKKMLFMLTLFAAIAWMGATGLQEKRQELAARKAANSCTTKPKRPWQCECAPVDLPVCGCNGLTYGSPCMADCAGVLYWTDGPCPPGR